MQASGGDKNEMVEHEQAIMIDKESLDTGIKAQLEFNVHCQDVAFPVSLEINGESSLFQVKQSLARKVQERGVQPSLITFFVHGRSLMLSKSVDLSKRNEKKSAKSNTETIKHSDEAPLHMTINENFYINGDAALSKLEGLNQTIDALVERQIEHSKVVCFDSLVDAPFSDQEISFNVNRRIVLKGFSFLNRHHSIEVKFDVENIRTGEYTYLEAKLDREPGEPITIFCENGLECYPGDLVFLRRSGAWGSEGGLYQLRSHKDWMIGDDGCEFRFLPSKKKVIAQIFYEAIN